MSDFLSNEVNFKKLCEMENVCAKYKEFAKYTAYLIFH